MSSSHDVIILGGGLAGLTLAIQLKRRFADINVLVLERRAHPVPHACHKVGESTVEIGAHYFEQVLGLQEHLQQHHLRKFGFRFFFSEGRRDIDNVTELGASRPLPVSSWQIDRGIFENFLAQHVASLGATFVDEATVRQVQLGMENALHHVTWQRDDVTHTTTARWVIDASGRAGLLKRQMNLALENVHPVHAVWFRISSRIELDRWSSCASWHARCVTPTRWLSTNHLVGEGYWVWLIPLSSGSHSVGIVADPRYHSLDQMDTFDRAMQWLERYQPALYDELDHKRDQLQDFAFFRHVSYDCKQLFSADRWTLTGEAGRFLDPFYSPGSDFIAIGNTLITELIARDRAGQRIGAHVQVYEQMMRSFYDSTLALYVDQYGLFGDPEVLPVKVIWDYTYYWGVLAQLFFQSQLGEFATLATLRNELHAVQQLNLAVQQFLREWGKVSCKRNHAIMLDQASEAWFVELNRRLRDPVDSATFVAHMRTTCMRLQALALQIAMRATAEYSQLDATTLRDVALVLGDPSSLDTAAQESMLFAPLSEVA